MKNIQKREDIFYKERRRSFEYIIKLYKYNYENIDDTVFY